MTLEVENEGILLNTLASGFNLFLGAGFSVLAESMKYGPLPTGSILKRELADSFNLASMNLDAFDLSAITTIIETTSKEELRRFLTERFTVAKYDQRYAILDAYPVRTIFTTNIDDLPFKIFDRAEKSYLSDLYSSGPAYHERNAIDIATLHGCVNDARRPYLFSTLDVAAAFTRDPDGWHYLRHRLRQFPTLFVGYSLEDAGTLQALATLYAHQTAVKDRWLLLRRGGFSSQLLPLFTALGFQIIWGDVDEFLSYLRDHARSQSPQPQLLDTQLQTSFPNDTVPPRGKVVVRPITDFFRGAPPEWGDIFSDQIHELRWVRDLTNAILLGRRCLAVGMIGSGKTTMMMQLAAKDLRLGNQLITESLPLTKAQNIVNVVGSAPLLIYIDNFTNWIESVSYLSLYPNIQIVGFDRDYNFEIVSHLVPLDEYYILNVTDVSDADIQSCIDTLPLGLRRSIDQSERSSRRRHLSLFELIESSVDEPTLRERFVSVLEQLDREDHRLSQLLVLLGFVQRCGTPVSMDMALAFLGDDISDYNDVYVLVHMLGSMVSEVAMAVPSDESQDCFAPRSMLVGDAIVAAASSKRLSECVTRFSKSVSPLRIPNHEVFIRKAYDNNLMFKAFPQVDDGIAFYEQLYELYDSPYILQHGALYASKKRDYQRAFAMINRAVSIAGERSWTIRNSSAVILFNANFDHYHDDLGRSQLHRSLDVLATCYHSDRRKAYHATTFANQALRLWKTYGDLDALARLRLAETWLVDESIRSPWHRMVRVSLNDVRRVLASESRGQ